MQCATPRRKLKSMPTKKPTTNAIPAIPVDEFIDAVEAALTPLANPKRAREMQAYMRDKFRYLGIGTPDRRAALKPLHAIYQPATAAEVRLAAETLWARPEREYQYAAIGLLDRQSKLLELPDVEWLLELVQQKSWWDTVDALSKIIGSIAQRSGVKGHRRMDAALQHENLWVRRIALLHQLGWREATDTERLFHYALKLAAEKDFFICKAIGWSLRDYAWHDWKAVEAFLAEHGSELSPLSVREATKNFAKLKQGGKR
jgi:3-methyladenine DNA glycosylase AlkD